MQTINVVQLDDSAATPTRGEAYSEAKRQLEICNACRYCESYCSVFPALHQQRAVDDEHLTQLANLCHNCRGCYYACQYTAPHEFNLNVPQALAEVRQQSWEEHSYPKAVAKSFHQHGSAIMLALVAGFALLLWILSGLEPQVQDVQSLDIEEQEAAQSFYALMPHNAMVALFLPAFVLPLIAIGVGLRRYWTSVQGQSIKLTHIRSAFNAAANMRNLDGGHGKGCNFEDEDRYSNARRYLHQATMYGFLLCFMATSVATLMHYLLDMPAPYGFFSLPKLLGVSGGILLCIGTAGLAWLKTQADPKLGSQRVWGGEMAFVVLLFLVSVSGLLLYWLGGTSILPELLAFHLGSVLTLFLLMPYSKMVHGFFRLAALIRDAQST